MKDNGIAFQYKTNVKTNTNQICFIDITNNLLILIETKLKNLNHRTKTFQSEQLPGIDNFLTNDSFIQDLKHIQSKFYN